MDKQEQIYSIQTTADNEIFENIRCIVCDNTQK